MTAVTTQTTAPVSAPPLAGPTLRRIRFAVAAVAVLIFGGYLVAQLTGGAGRPLDPDSAARNGAKALATLLRGYGVQVTATSALDTSRLSLPGPDAIVVTDPNAYSAQQLGELHAVTHVVLAGPAPRLLRAVLQATGDGDQLVPGAAAAISGPVAPGCTWAGGPATGTVELPADTIGYRLLAGTTFPTCYRGALIFAGGTVALGSADLLRNDHLGDQGVAALAVNAITDNRRVRTVEFLLPGGDATAAAAPTTWALFPSGARRSFVALAIIGLVLVLWRARRLGPVVDEPLPVVVRSAELVEGHGRLYRRAGARVRAAAALREATRHRLRRHLGLPGTASAALLASAVGTRIGREPAAVAALLDGAPPPDDASLVRLADDLDVLATASGVPSATEGPASRD